MKDTNVIDSLFPTPIFIHDFKGDTLNKIQDEIDIALPEIETYRKKSTDAGQVDSTFRFNDDQYVSDIIKFKLDHIKNIFTEAVHAFAYSIKYKGPFLSLDGSWFNFFEKDGFYYDHNHPGVKVAGVYYYRTTNQDGKLRFQNPNPYMFFGNWPADGMDEECIYYPPIQGRLMLWPAWMVHRVELNHSDQTRISIGINFK